jgi:deoxyribonuclease-4
VGAFRSEIERCITIGAEYLVAHPGNYKGQSLEEGLLSVVEGLASASHGLSSQRLTILLENTVGAGAQLGSRFEELEVIRRFAQDRMDIDIGFCIDTCHCFASGNYPVGSAEGLTETVRSAETILAMEKIRVIHANDSKAGEGSKLDRHENIGAGKIGMEAFARIVNHPKLRDKAFILETPGENPDEEKKDIETLQGLLKPIKKGKRNA